MATISTGQALPAFIAALLREGVDPQVVERAVLHVQCLNAGDSLSNGDPLARAFAFEQAKLLED